MKNVIAKIVNVCVPDLPKGVLGSSPTSPQTTF